MIEGSFPMSKVLVFEGNSYVCWKNDDIRWWYFMIENDDILWLHMVKSVIKGSFPITKVLVFGGKS